MVVVLYLVGQSELQVLVVELMVSHVDLLRSVAVDIILQLTVLAAP